MPRPSESSLAARARALKRRQEREAAAGGHGDSAVSDAVSVPLSTPSGFAPLPGVAQEPGEEIVLASEPTGTFAANPATANGDGERGCASFQAPGPAISSPGATVSAISDDPQDDDYQAPEAPSHPPEESPTAAQEGTTTTRKRKRKPKQPKVKPVDACRAEIERRVCAGESDQQISEAFLVWGMKVSAATVAKRRVQWGLRKRAENGKTRDYTAPAF
jgi:hypothetical protein